MNDMPEITARDLIEAAVKSRTEELEWMGASQYSDDFIKAVTDEMLDQMENCMLLIGIARDRDTA